MVRYREPLLFVQVVVLGLIDVLAVLGRLGAQPNTTVIDLSAEPEEEA